MTTGFSAEALVTNRAAVLVVGGAEADRRQWAQLAAASWELPLVDASDPVAFPEATARINGVVYVADVTRLSGDLQRELTRILHDQEERPKLVLGLPTSAETAMSKGALRDDLWFSVRRAVVNVADPEVKGAMKRRQAKARTH